MAKYTGQTLKYMHGNPDGFGMMYVGSSKARQNKLKHKLLNKNR